MSSGTQKTRTEMLKELAQELRQLYGLGATFFRAAATRVGMTITDLEVVDLLDSIGPATAGQLADLTGLTTGAITGMLNRLEEAGLVSREKDPTDGRRVIVQLTSDQDKLREISSIFDSTEAAWSEMASRYDDEQIALLLDFLQQSNAQSRNELARLREAPQDEEEAYSAPLGDITSGRLVVPTGIARLVLRASNDMTKLYQAEFEGAMPEVKTQEGVVTIRYPRRLWMLTGGQGLADVALNTTIPWWIAIQGGVSDITARLGNLNLAGLEVKGGMSMVHLELPMPANMVPIRISGGASEISMRRPAGVPAKVHLKGWASTFIFDSQMFGNLGNDVRLQSPGYEASAPGYDIEVASSVSMVTITTD